MLFGGEEIPNPSRMTARPRSFVCFRVKAADEAAADRLNTRLVEPINAGGETYLMQTKLRGRAVMRLGLGNRPHHRRAPTPCLGDH